MSWYASNHSSIDFQSVTLPLVQFFIFLVVPIMALIRYLMRSKTDYLNLMHSADVSFENGDWLIAKRYYETCLNSVATENDREKIQSRLNEIYARTNDEASARSLLQRNIDRTKPLRMNVFDRLNQQSRNRKP